MSSPEERGLEAATKKNGGPEIPPQPQDQESQIEQGDAFRNHLESLKDLWLEKAQEYFNLPLGHTSAIKGQAFQDCAKDVERLLAKIKSGQ